MRRSQEQPAMKATAAGGRRMATIMRRTSEDLTIVTAEERRKYVFGCGGVLNRDKCRSVE